MRQTLDKIGWTIALIGVCLAITTVVIGIGNDTLYRTITTIGFITAVTGLLLVGLGQIWRK